MKTIVVTLAVAVDGRAIRFDATLAAPHATAFSRSIVDSGASYVPLGIPPFNAADAKVQIVVLTSTQSIYVAAVGDTVHPVILAAGGVYALVLSKGGTVAPAPLIRNASGSTATVQGFIAGFN